MSDGAWMGVWGRARRRVPWSNLMVLVVGLWALPRFWPHVRAVAGLAEPGGRRPAYVLTTRTGEVLTPERLRGHVVLVNVWATWCLPCRAEMPALQQLASAFAQEGVIVLGLAADRGPAAAVDAFLRARGVTYPVAMADGATLAAFGDVRGYPTSFLLDREGVVRHTVIGPIAPLTLRPAIYRLLNDSAGHAP